LAAKLGRATFPLDGDSNSIWEEAKRSLNLPTLARAAQLLRLYQAYWMLPHDLIDPSIFKPKEIEVLERRIDELRGKPPLLRVVGGTTTIKTGEEWRREMCDLLDNLCWYPCDEQSPEGQVAAQRRFFVDFQEMQKAAAMDDVVPSHFVDQMLSGKFDDGPEKIEARRKSIEEQRAEPRRRAQYEDWARRRVEAYGIDLRTWLLARKREEETP
jgi:hypothetical protein